MAEQGATSFEPFLDHTTNAAQSGAALCDQCGQCLDGAPAGQKIVDEQDAVLRFEVLWRDDQLDDTSLGVAGGLGDVPALRHGDWAFFAGIDQRHLEFDSGCQGGGDAADLSGDDLGDLGHVGLGEASGKAFSHLYGQLWVELVVDKAIDFENSIAQGTSFGANAVYKQLHKISFLNISHCSLG